MKILHIPLIKAVAKLTTLNPVSNQPISFACGPIVLVPS